MRTISYQLGTKSNFIIIKTHSVFHGNEKNTFFYKGILTHIGFSFKILSIKSKNLKIDRVCLQKLDITNIFLPNLFF